MASFEISGRLSIKNDTVTVSDKFTKREFVIETEGQYPQLVALQLSQDKCGLLDRINIGTELTVSVNLRGRKWTGPDGVDKYFNTLDVWKIQGGTTEQPEPGPSGPTAPAPAVNPEDDLPF